MFRKLFAGILLDKFGRVGYCLVGDVVVTISVSMFIFAIVEKMKLLA
jgi:hypothetical protein